MANEKHFGSGSRAARFRRWWLATAILVVSCAMTPRAVAVNDAIMEWNQIALNATVTAGQGPLPQARSMTIVQVAVHDAVNVITRKHRTYLSNGQSALAPRPRPPRLRRRTGRWLICSKRRRRRRRSTPRGPRRSWLVV